MAIKLEDSFERAQWYAGEKMFQSRIRGPYAWLKQIDSVTSTQIQSVAKIVLQTKSMSLAAVGPFKNSSDFLKKIGL
jgi:predicted Zn-dependent peptidase